MHPACITFHETYYIHLFSDQSNLLLGEYVNDSDDLFSRELTWFQRHCRVVFLFIAELTDVWISRACELSKFYFRDPSLLTAPSVDYKV